MAMIENVFDTKKLTINQKINLVKNLLEETESSFDKSTILSAMMKSLNCNIYEAQRLFDEAIEKNFFIHTKNIPFKKLPLKIYSTSKMIKVEKNIIKQFRLGRDKISHFLDKIKIDKYLDDKFNWLTSGQRKSIEHTLFCSDRFSIICGDAGTGKTTSMAAIKDILDKNIQIVLSKMKNDKKLKQNQLNKINKIITNHYIKGMSFTGKAAIELEKGAKIKSTTIHSFINKKGTFKNDCEKENIDSNLIKDRIRPLWIVDESSMVGSLDMNKIINKAIIENAKVVFVGDGKQLKSISAGDMFCELQKIDSVSRIELNQNLRQKNNRMKKTVILIKKHLEQKDNLTNEHIDDMFKVLEENSDIVENKLKEELLERISKDYSNDFKNRKTLILCHNNETKDNINLKTRSVLKNDGLIAKEEIEFTCYDPVSLSGYKKYFAENYTPGLKAFIYHDNGKYNSDLIIKDINQERNLLFFKGKDNKTVAINPLSQIKDDFRISISNQTKRSFSKGERVVFQKNDKLLGVQNGLAGTIENVSDNGILKIKTDNNQCLNISEKNYPYLNYGYALTTHKSQGQTCDRVLFVSKAKDISNAQSLYVGVTRAKHDIKIYTDDKNEIKKSLSYKQEKTITLDLDKRKEISLSR